MSANPAKTLPIDAMPDEARAESGMGWFDKLGITASFACLVHCLIAPFLLILLPTFGSIWADAWVHWVLAVLVLPLAVMVIWRGARRHGKRWVIVAALLGAGLVTAGLIAPMINDRPLFHAPAPGFLAGFADSGGAVNAAGAPAASCADGCCPTLTTTEAGAATLGLPAGGLLTMLGSVMLIAGHTGNLLACRCLRRGHAGDGADCGCPA